MYYGLSDALCDLYGAAIAKTRPTSGCGTVRSFAIVTRRPGKRTVPYNTLTTSKKASEERALQGQPLQEGMGMN